MKKRWEDKVKRIEHLEQLYNKWPLSPPYKPKLSKPWQPSSIWKIFCRQNLAFSFAKGCKEEVHVFALEKEGDCEGQRIYLVTTYTQLWHYYRMHIQSLMHCYEVIPEGCVCKLYFDLEFHKPSNKEANGKNMVAALIQYVCQKLEEVYQIKCCAEDVLNLDSSTEERFSRHLIFLLCDAAFKDNLHAGNFVKSIMDPGILELQRQNHLQTSSITNTSSASHLPKSNEELESSTRKRQNSTAVGFPPIFVKDKSGRETLFVDLGVYTKNRNFRVYKSTKANKKAALNLADDNMFMLHPRKGVLKEEDIFLSSLISNVRFTDRLRILTFEENTIEKSKYLCGSETPSCFTADVAGQNVNSPYPEVDNFILSLVNGHGVQGGIRRWNYFCLEELLVYDISKYRWCQNIQRPHKSNNIMILVDLRNEVWYQKCHDPVCKADNYKSKACPLPPDICLSFLLTEDPEDIQYTMDRAGNIELSPNTASHEEFKQTPQLEWDDGADDELYLKVLEDVEEESKQSEKRRKYAEIPDELLLEALNEHETLMT
ncbi:DNA-directed primase/polymerase protein isoform X2 [Polypterus senegalus]|nr:DNA-directed primase/polymerase protein isoform X2 [Polypterus senegalus]